MGELLSYAKAVGAYWIAIMGVITFVSGDLGNWVGFREWLDKLLTKERRRPIEVTIMIAVVFWAGFSAWDDETQIAQHAEWERQGAIQWLEIWKTRADERWTQIHGKGGYADQIARAFPTSSLIMTTDMPKPSEIGGSTIELNYFIANNTPYTSTLNDIGIVEIYSNRTGGWLGINKEISLCDKIPIDFMSRMKEYYSKTPVIGSTTDRNYYYVIYHPDSLYLNGNNTKLAMLNIAPNTTGNIAASFNTHTIDTTKYNTVLICPFIKTYDAYNNIISAICPGFGSAKLNNNKSTEAFSEHYPLVITPLTQPSFCRR